ncbi:MAG TPA: sorbosone dehydrogenase family protein [Rhizomicrobium sp.]|jgi:glucose/arabinose dehydrogenase|nr:sorbosone dehydrogenase family protein [Rhizomicrobium sp.]
MKTLRIAFASACCALLLAACGQGDPPPADNFGSQPSLPAPQSSMIPTAHFSTATPWPDGTGPQAPRGFFVYPFAKNLDHPRWLYVLPNGDVLAAESTTLKTEPHGLMERIGYYLMRNDGSRGESADTIVLLRDANEDSVAETKTVFLKDKVKQPFGMALVGNTLYVAGTGGVWAFDYHDGDLALKGDGKKIMDLPVGGYNNHWTRNIVASEDGKMLFVTVGSGSNVGENGADNEKRRANVIQINLDGSNEHIFTSGTRNPNGLAYEPTTHVLWTVVNERDMLGDDLVPDYLTRVQDGDFYGWPWSYWGKHVDDRVTPQNPAMVAKAIAPDYALGAHTASLGLVFYTGDKFPAQYNGAAFITQHGSWNRSYFTGFKVVYVRFKDGMPFGAPQDFLTGFMPDPTTGIAHGRPVGIVQDKRGGLLVADDTGGVVWRVAAAPIIPPSRMY